MLSDAVSALCCPICQDGLALETGPRRALRCPVGHSFDAAKQGYFNLLTGKGTAFEADSAAMAAARHGFLSAGHYTALADALGDLALPGLLRSGAVLFDSGTGTGNYLRAILDRAPAASIGLDISKFALRRAARLNPDTLNLVWDVWRPLPLRTGTVDVVTVVFAPRNPGEFARVLRPGGRAIVVTPRPGHLAEISGLTGMLRIEEGKDERLAESMGGQFVLAGQESLDIRLQLDEAEAADLAFMGPAGHHLDRQELLDSLRDTGPVETTAKFSLTVFTTPPYPS
ncbi:putative RNA methyltransferase [Arthrobacter celericrescens]|uniref:putative RNA methyltransferase n=1 Tax=Arthrobacter celericrescens TaxID=2320851 RepID=UPI000EA125C4|nr:methyltransferase domain-containing protein [Arthrobacter celericrescens]